MIPLNLEKVRANVHAAGTEDLLDRVTVYRVGMEEEALRIIESELRERGITPADIDAHARQREAHVLMDEAGVARKCTWCHQPAIGEGWRWHRLWGLVPIFPRWINWCAAHAPE
jgi:hypothetical protein